MLAEANSNNELSTTTKPKELCAILIDASSSMIAGIPDNTNSSTSIKPRILAAVEAVQAIVSTSTPSITAYAFFSFQSNNEGRLTYLWEDYTQDYLNILTNCYPQPEGGTPMGMSLNDVLAHNPKPQRIILLSDGQPDNRQEVENAVQNAKALKIIIDTVGIGAADEGLMSWIAKETGGRYHNAKTASELSHVFQALETKARGLLEFYNGQSS